MFSFPLDIVFRIYDNVIASGVEAIFGFSIVLLQRNEEALLKLKFDDILAFLKNKLFERYKVSILKYKYLKHYLNLFWKLVLPRFWVNRWCSEIDGKLEWWWLDGVSCWWVCSGCVVTQDNALHAWFVCTWIRWAGAYTWSTSCRDGHFAKYESTVGCSSVSISFLGPPLVFWVMFPV